MHSSSKIMQLNHTNRNDDEEGMGNNHTEQKPPVYEVQPSIPPPDYRDALQDAPTTHQAMMMEEVPLDDQEVSACLS